MQPQSALAYPDDHRSILASPSSATPEADQSLIAAINLHQAGRSVEAERLYRAIIASPSDHAVASYGLGLLCAAQGRSREAIEAYLDAIAIRPDFVDAYINLGTMMLGLGRGREAEAMYRHAVALSPENAMAHGNLGKALHDLGRIDEAIAAYRTGIALQPDSAVIHANFGAALLEQQAWDDAATVTRRAIALDAADTMAHANLGTALLHLGRHQEALAACRECIALQPQGPAIHATLGGVMLELGEPQEAASLCRHSIALDPIQPDAHFNLSHALKGMNRLDEAALAAREAIALRPESADYHFHLAHILLLQGDFEHGWSEYEWRKQQPDFAWIGNLLAGRPQPLWLGEDIGDKTILVFTEQGLGDIIQFARYLPLLVRRAGRVIVAASPRTLRLLGTIEGIEVVPLEQVPQQNFDVYCPLLSLPRAFGTRLDNIPAQVPYLHADPSETARWNERIGGGAFRVGIVWAGNPATVRDRFRSPRLSSVAPLFSTPGVDFVVLQVGPGRSDCDAMPLPPHVLDLGNEVTDLTDTAAIMAGLDLMISSCTGPLHLAGALGVPTWAMIPFAPHFPWRLEHTDTAWYPTMRLYRQEQFGQDWSGVVGRIGVDLVAMAQSKLDLQRTAAPPRDVPPASATKATSDGSLGQTIGLPRQQAPETEGFNELAHCRGALMLFNRNDIHIGACLRKYGEFSYGESKLLRQRNYFLRFQRLKATSSYYIVTNDLTNV